MNMTPRLLCSVVLCLCALTAPLAAQERPSLILTAEGVESIKDADTDYPLFERAFEEAEVRLARALAEGVVMPAPKDPGGGYTHERHKENYKIVHDAGVLYQLTGDERYRDLARDYLLAYAGMYKDLPLHPARKKQTPGKLFWQGLNESVWLVYVIQGYDAVADGLDRETRGVIENDLLRPAADFLSVGSPQTFRRIHNHGTWAAAAVGMTGYALRDRALVERALFGLDGDGSSGFLAQLDQLFSPDGYYTEGPYYQRYALMPFVLFAQAIENNEPGREIFQHRDGILLKAIDATIQQSYGGKFFPINDAIKEKGLDTIELVYGVATAHALTGREGLLSIAGYQGRTVLTGEGLEVARRAVENDDEFGFRTMLLRDGPDGDQGGLAILRMGEGELAQTLVAKNTGHGFGHGHFDKLSYIFYDAGREILTDYGAARFLNVPTKEGGRYLPENQSWAKQTVAHNTLVVDETSQFDGDWRRSQEHWAEVEYFEAGDDLNVVSASLDDAYPDATLSRTVVQLKHEAFAAPVIIDLLRGENDAGAVRYDLPFYFQGQVVDFSGALDPKATERRPLGDAAGYQHLWVEARGASENGRLRLSWLKDRRFYTLHAAAPPRTEAVFVRVGANDPDFNLRNEKGVILRAPKRKEAVFVSIIEPHGVYDPAAEFTTGSESAIAGVAHHAVGGADLIVIETRDGEEIRIAISHDPDATKTHEAAHLGATWRWNGFVAVVED